MENLLEKVKNVESEYENSSKIRKAMRRIRKYAEAVATWLVALPRNFAHAAVAYGGTKLLLEAAARLGEASADAFKILGEIPKALASMAPYVTIYKSQPVQAKNEEIYKVLIELFEYALSWLYKNPASMLTAIFTL